MSDNRALADRNAYALQAAAARDTEAPILPYEPPLPGAYRPGIALIGAGGISAAHLDAYARANLNVAIICDVHRERAQARRDEFFPQAQICTDVQQVFDAATIEIVDLSVHPAPRVGLIERALNAGKHVLSQKPFVLDLDVGDRLISLAKARGRSLAVNQNGRWAPHLSYMRQAVKRGLVGTVASVHVDVHWDHGWVAGTAFEDIDDLILFDFGIHWFDFVASVIGEAATQVFATRSRAGDQVTRPPLLAQALMAFPEGQASIVLNGSARFDPVYRMMIDGSAGSLSSHGNTLSTGTVTMTSAAGKGAPLLQGSWFNDGFLGAMGELLCAIEQQREPENSAANCLAGLGLCLAAVQSSHSGMSERPGIVRRIDSAPVTEISRLVSGEPRR